MSLSDNSRLSPNAQIPPACPKCGQSMTLTRIDPHTPGMDQRSYECENCGTQEQLLVPLRLSSMERSQ